jgi:hypothetical protein
MVSLIDAGGWVAHFIRSSGAVPRRKLEALPVSAARQPKSSFELRHLLRPVEAILPDFSQRNEDDKKDHSRCE